MSRSLVDRVEEYVGAPRLDQRARRGTAISAHVHGRAIRAFSVGGENRNQCLGSP